MKNINLAIIFSFLWLASCGLPAFTPWEQNVAKEKLNLKSLEKLFYHGLPFRVALLADPQGRPNDLEVAIKAINKKQVDFILLAGDITDYSLKHEYEQAIHALHETDLPVFTVSGNHDGLAYGKSIYQDLFGPLDYDFNYGPFNFVMWNNNQFEYGETNFTAFSSRLKENSIVVSHIPPSADAHSEEQYSLWKKIYKEKMPVLSLHGHLHHDTAYELEKTTVFIADRTTGARYHILTFTSSGVIIENCKEAQCFERYKKDWPHAVK